MKLELIVTFQLMMVYFILLMSIISFWIEKGYFVYIPVINRNSSANYYEKILWTYGSKNMENIRKHIIELVYRISIQLSSLTLSDIFVLEFTKKIINFVWF